jgi:AcrR family transcriptional regulator
VPAIAEAAARIADQEGYPALSMQRVAAEVGVTKMALYRYVAGKGELDAVMIELSVDEPPDLSGVPGGWRPRVERFVRELGEVWRRHPWLPWATVGDRVMGPREVGWVECAFAAFDGAGLTADERRQAVFVLFGHVRNTQSPATAGTQPWSGGAGPSAVLREVLDRHADRFPVLAALPPPAGPDDDLGRAFGLRCLLDGIETLVAGRAAAAR